MKNNLMSYYCLNQIMLLLLVFFLSCLSLSVPYDIQRAIEKRLTKVTQSRSSPLSQSWYKAKQQHVSSAQKKAISTYWNISGITLKYNETLRLDCIFQKKYEHFVLDIGFGLGDSCIYMAERNPLSGYLGVEIHRSGIGSALIKIHSSDRPCDYSNIRVVRSDVAMLLDHLEDQSLDEVSIFFPDPWPNTERDEQRRVMRPAMVEVISKKIKSGGLLRLATDVEDYARYAADTMVSFNDKGWLCR